MTVAIPDYVTEVTNPGMHSMPGLDLTPDNVLHPNLLQLAGQFLENFLQSVVRAVFGFFPGGDTAFNLLSQWGEQLNINLTQLGDDIGTLVWRLLNEPLEVIGELPQVIINGLEDTLSTLGNWIETIVNGFAGALGLPMVGDFIDRIFDISDELAWVQEKAGEAWEDLGILVNKLLTDPIAVIGEIPKALVGGLEDTLTTLGNWIETLVDSILGALGLSTAGDFLSKVFDLSDEFQWIQEKAGEAWEDLGELIQNLLHNPGAVLGQITQGMVAGLDQLGKFIFGGRSVGTNLVSDPGMEDPAEWANQVGTMSTAQRHSGTSSREVIANGSNRYLYLQSDHRGLANTDPNGMWKVQPGEKYYFEGWIYLAADVVKAGTTPRIVAGFYDSTGQNTATTVSVAGSASWTDFNLGTWQKIKGYGTVPAGFDRMMARASINANNTVGNRYHWDDFIVREVTESQNIVERIFGAVGDTVSQIAGFLIPNLDVTKIMRGVENLGTYLTNEATKLTDLLRDLLQNPGAVIGQLTQGMVAGLENLATFLFGRSQAGSNLVTDPGFEKPEMWAGLVGMQVTNERSRGGQRSMKVTSATANRQFAFSQDHRSTNWSERSGYWKVQPGEKYYVEAWVYAPSTNTFGTGTAPLIRAVYGDEKNVNALGGTTVANPSWATIQAGANSWQKWSGYFTVPAGQDLLTFIFRTETSDPVGNVYFLDDIAVREVTESQNIVQRIFGAVGDTISQIAGSLIPNLDVTKIMRGVENLGTILTNTATDIAGKLSLAIFGGRIQSGSNLVTDTEFETEIWSASGMASSAAVSTEQKRSGARSIKMTGPSRSIFMIGSQEGRKDLAVEPGDKFYADCWFYLPSANGATSNGVRIDAYYTDSTGQNSTATTSLGTLAYTSAKNTWIKLSSVTTSKGYFTVPAGYDRLNFRITTHSSTPSTEVVYADDFVVREVTESQNIVQRIFGTIGDTVSQIAGALIPNLDVTKIMRGAQDLGTFLSNIPQNVVVGLEQLGKFLFGGQTTGTNLVTDPGFEDAAEWPTIRGAGAMSTEQKRSGTQSRKITTTAATQAIFFAGDHRGYGTADERNLWKVKPGDKYFVEAWVFGAAGNVTGTGTAPRLWVNMRDTNGVATESYPNVSAPTWTQWNTARGTWYQLSGYVTVPAGCNRIRPAIEFTATEPAGNVYYIDDLMLREVTESQNLVQRIFGSVGDTLSQIAGALIPNLDVTKIMRGAQDLGTFLSNIPQNVISGLSDALGALLPKWLFNNTSAAQTNLVTDPTIDRTEIWNGNFGAGGTSVVSTEQSMSGTTGLKITVSGNGYIVANMLRNSEGASAQLNTQGGEKFYAEYYGRVAAATTNVKQMYLQYQAYDSKGVLPMVSSTASSHKTVNSTGWTKVSGEYTIPAGYDRLEVFFGIMNQGTAGSVYYADNLLVREQTVSKNIIEALFGAAGQITANIIGAVIPSLDVTKIMRGAQDLGTYLTTEASKLSELIGKLLSNPGEVIGQLTQSMVTGLSQLSKFIFGGRSVGTNLVTDPGFEDDAEWVGNTAGVQSAEQKRSGTKSRKYTTNGVTNYIYMNRDHRNLGWSSEDNLWKVQPGEKYYYEAWIYAPSTNNFTTGSTPRLWAAFIDSTGVLTRSDITVHQPSWAVFDDVKDGWQKLSGYLTVPAGRDRMASFVQFTSSEAVGNVYYVDDLLVREVTESQNIVAKIFGSVGSTVSQILGDIIPNLDVTKIIRGAENLSTILTNEALRLTNLITGLLQNPASVIGQLTQAMVGGLTNFVNWIRGAQNSGTNLVTDPSTSDPVIWSGTGIVGALSTDYKLSGTSSLRFNGNGTGTRATYTTRNETANYRVEVQPGEKYYYEVKVLPHPSNAGTAGTVAVGAGFTDATGTLAQTFPNARSMAANTMTKGQWTTLSGYVTVPAGYTLMSPRVTVNASVPASDYYYFTEFVVREVTESQNIVQRIFGAIGDTVSQIAGSVIPNLDVSKIMRGAQDLGSFLSAIPQNVITGLSSFIDFLRGNQRSGPNLLPDGGFENAALWNGKPNVNGAVSTEQSHSGTSSLKVPSTLNSYQVTYVMRDELAARAIETQPGEKFYFEAWAMPASANAGTTGAITLTVQVNDSKGVNATTYPTVASVNLSAAPRGQWTKLSGYWTVPAGFDRVQPYVQISNNVPTGYNIYWDDVVFKEVTEAQNIVQRIFGQVGSTVTQIIGDIIPNLDVTKIMRGAQDLGTFLSNIPQNVISGLGDALGALLPKGLFNSFNRTTNLASDPQIKNPALWNESYLAVNDGWVEVTKTTAYRRLNWFRTADGGVGSYMPTSHQRIYEVSCEAKLISGTAVANNLSLFLRGQNASGALQTISGATNFSITTTAQTVKIRATVSSSLTVDFMPIAEVNDANNNPTVMAFRNLRVVDVTEPQNIIQALWQGAGDILSQIAGAVIPNLDVTKIQRGAQDLGTWLNAESLKLTNLITDLFQNPGAVIGTLARSMVDGLQTALDNLNNFIQDVIDKLLQGLTGIPIVGGAIGNLLTQMGLLKGKADTADTKAGEAKDDAIRANNRVNKSSANNMVIDPGFDVPALWTMSTGCTLSTAQKRSGTQSLLMTGAAAARTMYVLNGNDSTLRDTLASENDKFYIEAYVFRPSGQSGTGSITLGLQWVNAAGTASTTGTVYTVAQSTITANSWQKISQTFTAPAGTVTVRPYIQIGSNFAAGNNLYWDDVVVREVTNSEQAKADVAAVKNDAGLITGGQLGEGRVPNLPQTKINDLGTDLLNANTKANNADAKARLTYANNLVVDPGLTAPELWSFTSGWGFAGTSEGFNRLLGTANGSATRTQRIAGLGRLADAPQVGGGDRMRLSYEYFRSSGNTDVGQLGVVVRSKRADGTYLDHRTGATYGLQSTFVKNTWTAVELKFTTPSDAVAVDLFVELLSDVPSGQTFSVRNVTLREETAAQNADIKAGSAKDKADGVAKNIADGWTGTTGAAGTLTEVTDTMTAIRTAVMNGYTVETITSSRTWTKPSGPLNEIIIVGLPAGVNGAVGNWTRSNSPNVQGGDGGLGGSYRVQVLTPSDVPSSVNISIGASNGAPTTFGSLVTIQSGSVPGIATQFGYTPTVSSAGNGGKGGSVTGAWTHTHGEDGQSSPTALGGAGGTSAGSSTPGGSGNATGGSPGFNANLAQATKCGGGGGGGGGARWHSQIGNNATATNGGAGGYPGGGGGGGGACATSSSGGSATPGQGGAGAAGVMWIYYK